MAGVRADLHYISSARRGVHFLGGKAFAVAAFSFRSVACALLHTAVPNGNTIRTRPRSQRILQGARRFEFRIVILLQWRILWTLGAHFRGACLLPFFLQSPHLRR